MSAWLYLAQQGLGALCLLCALGKAAGLGRFYPLRLLLTSVLTAAGSFFAAQTRWLQWLLIPLMLLSPMVAWPKIPARMRLRLMGLCAALSLTLTGCARLTYTLPVARMLQLPLACMMLLICSAFMRRGNVLRFVSVAIRRQSCRLNLTALVDSGNLLRDPVTGLPVIVISRRAAAKLTPLPAAGELLEGMRLMRIRTVTGTTLMTVFRPDSVFLSSGGAWHEVRAVIGLNPDGYEGFKALVPSSLLSGMTIDSRNIPEKEEMTP